MQYGSCAARFTGGLKESSSCKKNRGVYNCHPSFSSISHPNWSEPLKTWSSSKAKHALGPSHRFCCSSTLCSRVKVRAEHGGSAGDSQGQPHVVLTCGCCSTEHRPIFLGNVVGTWGEKVQILVSSTWFAPQKACSLTSVCVSEHKRSVLCWWFLAWQESGESWSEILGWWFFVTLRESSCSSNAMTLHQDIFL